MPRPRAFTATALLLTLSAALPAVAAESPAAQPVGRAIVGSAVSAAVAVDSFALVERAPVHAGYGLFTVEATNLLPAPRRRENFTPPEDEVTYPLRRTVERFLQRKEIPKGWSRTNEATFSFKSELNEFPTADGIAYAVEGELVVKGTKAVPVGASLSAPAGGPPLRYAVGLMAAGQMLMLKEGVLDGTDRRVGWMLSLHPNGPDAAIPVRAVFAVRAEGEDEAARHAVLAGISATLNASSDGRAAVAERTEDAAEWLKPMQVFVRPDQVAAKDQPKGDKKDEKKEKKGGH